MRPGLYLLLLLTALAPGTRAADVPLEPGVNRIGMDYRNIVLPDPDPQLCRKACIEDARCAAFTYVKPRRRGGPARCWLKEGVPPATRSDCCVSGVKLEETAPPDTATFAEVTPDVSTAGMARGPVSRATVIDALLAHPATAERLHDVAAERNRDVAGLAATSLAGETIGAAPQTPPAGPGPLELIELDWEAGVQFTPRNRWGQLVVDGMYLPGNKSLGQLYEADQLYLHAKGSNIHWSSAVHPGPGTYSLVVQMRMPKSNAFWVRIYVYETGASGETMRQVSPKSLMQNPDTPDQYVEGVAALLTLHESTGLKLLIKTLDTVYLDGGPAVFGGFTITRL